MSDDQKRQLRPTPERYPSHANNSDEDDNNDGGSNSSTSSSQKKSNVEDYVSFPTIPDPELSNTKSISGLLSKTLRKVTANASNLVLNYSQGITSPKGNIIDSSPFGNKNNDYRTINTDPSAITPKNDAIDETPINTDVPLRNETVPKKLDDDFSRTTSPLDIKPDKAPSVYPKITSGSVKKDSNVSPIERLSIVTNETTEPKLQPPQPQPQVQAQSQSQPQPQPQPQVVLHPKGTTLPQVPSQQIQQPQSESQSQSQSQSQQQQSSQPSQHVAHPAPPCPPISGQLQPPSGAIRQVLSERTMAPPRVTSDNKTLRISTMQLPRLQSVNNSTTSSVVNVNVLASVDVESLESDRTSNYNGRINQKGTNTDAKNYDRSLLNKISSIFNNLPNDIELSDDSASDLDTTRNDIEDDPGKNHGTVGYRENPSDASLGSMSKLAKQVQYDLSSRYSESIAKSSPVKAERKVATSFSTNLGQSPTVSSFHALQNKDLNATKKKTSHLSSVLLDNARTIINQNIGAVASSASSIVGGRRKKKKPKKASENPLKNGGIPKKYWMNDAFVSDCLNCFRPFTPFRRKHHCRFCGQIFCSECTLFISYTQHKDERNNRTSSNKEPYNDKLRVCKPCYSDVIIYLSDDSSSSESEMEKDTSVESVDLSKTKAEDLLVPNHPLSRIRSMSMSSSRDLRPSDAITRKPLLRDSRLLEGNTSITSNSNSPSRNNNIVNNNYNNGNSASSVNANSQFLYPDESIKVHPKQAPKMAIPTTRTGESIEIPLMRHSLVNSSILQTPGTTYGSSVNVGSLSPSHPQSQHLQSYYVAHHGHRHHNHNHHHHHHHHHNHNHHHHHTHNNTQKHLNISVAAAGGGVGVGAGDVVTSSGTGTDSQSSSKTWIKNHLSPGLNNASMLTSRSLDNLSSAYTSFMTRNPSFKLRVLSGNNNRDALGYGKESSQEPGDMQNFGNNHTLDRQEQNIFDEDDYDDEYEDVNEVQDLRGNVAEDEEDEHAMSLYASLNDSHGYGSTPLTHKPPPIHAHSGVVVPTLGEFPIMKSGFPHQLGNIGSVDIFHHNPVAFLTDSPSKQVPADSLRSRARAHASLQRMRSRRQGKATRNVLILTHNNLRLPSLDSPSHRANITGTSLTPITSPSSPGPSTSNTIANPTSNHSNLTTGLANSDAVSTSSGNQYSEMSPLGPRISTSTALEHYKPDDYFGSHENLLELEDHHNLMSWRDITMNENNNDKDKWYKDTMNFILRQSLKDCEIEDNIDLWMNVLSNLLEHIDDIKLTDTLDIRQYVKVKKILGGKIRQTEVIDGLFMTKNIDSKKMSSSIRNPRIALLMFPVEYLKQKEQFISLRIIHAQQSVYITNLVSRLISLEPDIIVIGDSICGLAEKLLEEAGVTVMSNVKPQVIERISRYTKADIFQSVNDLFFKKGKLGTCEEFAVKRFKYQNAIKSFVFFTGCDIQLGFTISLRGGDEELLNGVKYAAETLMPGYLNARFEKSFFENLLLNYIEGNKNEKIVEIRDKLEEVNNNDDNEEVLNTCEISLDSTEVVEYFKLFNERKLSLSPAVEFSLPTPLVNVITSYYSFYQFFQKHNQIQKLESSEDIDDSWLVELNINYKVDDLPGKGDELLRMLKCASEGHLKLLINEYHNRARVWSNCMRYPSYQLYPIFHRNIHVLHSTVSIKHATPCTGPGIVVIDYYTENDKCFGLFLDQAFHESSKVCNECGETYLDHYKSYVHQNAKVDLIMEKYDIQGNTQGKNQRVMWSSCKECNYTTPIIAMSDETYYLSIGKFFELSFYGENIVGGCEHDFFKSYVKCFGFNNLVIRLEYSTIDNYEIVVPKKKLDYITSVDIKLKVEAYKTIRTKADGFFDSILKRLNRVKLDTFDKAEAGMQKIKELKTKLQEHSENIYSRLESIYKTITPTNYLSLNVILRDLQKLGIYWDNEFNDFEKMYLPSENDVTRITQFQLRKFLMDKYPDKEVEMVDIPKIDKEPTNVETTVTPELLMIDTHSSQGSEQGEVGEMNPEGESKTEEELSKLPSPPPPPPPEFIPKKPRQVSITEKLPESSPETKSNTQSTLYEQNSNISERISKWNKTAEVGDDGTLKKLIHRGSEGSLKSNNNNNNNNSNTSNVIPSQNKVIHLANFFDKMYYDQISLEFSRQREREMKRKSKIKAQPVFDSKPIVEIYDQIEDVVGVEDDKKKPVEKEEVVKELPKELPKEIQDSKQLDIPEKQSLLKSLTNFWADRSATLWDPLSYALESHEHTFADSDVIVREDEPSSLVAFCLSSNDYKQKIKIVFEKIDSCQSEQQQRNDDEQHQHQQQQEDEQESQENQQEQQPQREEQEEQQVQQQQQQQPQNEEESPVVENKASNQYNEKRNAVGSDNKKKMEQFEKIERKFKKNFNTEGAKVSPLEQILTKSKSNHLKYQFIDGNTNLSCKIFYSEQFEALRKACGVDESFIQSLSRCVKWQSSGGKSGSSFLKTLDNRYILKELSKQELESFVSIAPFYFKYIGQSIFSGLKTAIGKIWGIYTTQVTTTGKVFKMDFLIMENLFYNLKNNKVFDLKGSTRNRYTNETGEVLLDENMIEYIYESPVFVSQVLKQLLRGCLFNDTLFLKSMEVMDYSLVVGFNDESKEMIVGIIDWLRTFTWDKRVENWVKGIGSKRDPTIVTPKQYRNRFRAAMERYILEVPDCWYHQ